MTRSRLLLGVASVLAGTTVLLGVFGLVYNPVLLLAAVPFAAATYLIWSHATGRLEARMRERAAPRGREAAGRGDVRSGRAGRTAWTGGGDAGPRRSGLGDPPGGPGPADGATHARRPPPSGDGEGPTRSAAARVLGVDPGADETTIRRAFREKARELHPDAPDGDEAEFRRVRMAYERLTGRQ